MELKRSLLKCALGILVSGAMAVMPFQASATNISVSGVISAPVTWSADTVFVDGDVSVNNGVSLTVNPGVKVIFTGHYHIIVQGSMRVNGTEGAPVLFTVSDTTGFTNMTIPNGGWQGIRLDSLQAGNDSSVFRYCHFEYGKANGSGKDAHGGALFINAFSKVKIVNCSFDHCWATSDGGAVYVKAATAYISGNTFTNGKSGRGAGICCDNSWPLIRLNTFSKNYATSMGGAIACVSSAAPDMINNLMYDNLAYLGGGMAFFNAGNLSRVVNSTITNNRANYGGGVSSIATDATFTNTILFSNIAAAGHEVTLLDTDSDPNFYYCDIQGGLTDFGGSGSGAAYSGIYQDNMNAYPEFNDTASTDYSIRTISPCMDAGTPDTTGLHLAATDIAGNGRINMARIDIGAYERQQVVNVCGNITQNTIWNADTVKVECDITIADGATLSIVPGVYVEMQGWYGFTVRGSLQATGTAGEEIMFTPKNIVSGWKGILFDTINPANDSTLLEYCTFQFTNDPAGPGTLCFLSTSRARVSDCEFLQNVQFVSGGITLWFSGPRIMNCSFLYNNGSGVGGKAGALYVAYDSEAIVEGCVISMNTAGKSGGVCCEAAELTLVNCLLTNNYGQLTGAGAVYADSADVEMINCILANNYSQDHGGAAIFRKAEGELVNCNVVNNQSAGNGAGIYSDESLLDIINSILYGNELFSGDSNQIYIEDSLTIIDIAFSNIRDDSSGIALGTYADWSQIAYEDNISTDPLFVDPTACPGMSCDGLLADWSLDPCSPMYNMGEPDTVGMGLPLLDFGGSQRIFADTIDIGAYELVKPYITQQPVDYSVCQGGDAWFGVEVESNIPLSFEWQLKPFGAGSFNTAPGISDQPEYNLAGVSGAQDGDQYRCIITAACSQTLTSSTVTLHVQTNPQIGTEPVPVSVCQGAQADFNITASGSVLTYQWQQRPFGSSVWSNCIGASATTAHYIIPSVPLALNNYSYRCIVGGACPPADTSLVVNLTVLGLPSIVTNPTNVSVCEGGNASFTVSASGSGITYQWQESTNGGGSYSDLSGQNGTTLNLTAVTAAMSGYRYRCVVSGDCTPPANSNGAILTVNTPPVVNTEPVDQDVCVYSTVTISVVASGGNLAYQWEQKAPADLVWSNAPGLSALSANYQIMNVSMMNSGYKYRCQISGSCNPPTTSDSMVLTVHNLPPFYLGQDTSLLLSESIMLDAGGGFSSYEWSTTETTQTIVVTGSVIGVGIHPYSCTITDSYGCENNDGILVTVYDDTGLEEAGSDDGFTVASADAGDHCIISYAGEHSGDYRLSVHNIHGSVVYEGLHYFSKGVSVRLDGARWTAGCYFINIRGTEIQRMIRWVKF